MVDKQPTRHSTRLLLFDRKSEEERKVVDVGLFMYIFEISRKEQGSWLFIFDWFYIHNFQRFMGVEASKIQRKKNKKNQLVIIYTKQSRM